MRFVILNLIGLLLVFMGAIVGMAVLFEIMSAYMLLTWPATFYLAWQCMNDDVRQFMKGVNN